MIPVAASWRGVGMDAEINEEELAGAIAAGAAAVRWPPEQQVCGAVVPFIEAVEEVMSPRMGSAEELLETKQRQAV